MDYILYLRDKNITIIQAEAFMQGDFETEALEWDDEVGIENFLSQVPPKATLSIVLDFIDENLHYEWVPRLLPWEKPAIEKRLINKAKSEGALFVHTHWMPVFQTNFEGREEQQVLVDSVFDSAHLRDLLTSIEEAQLSIQSVYSYAFLIESFFLSKVASRLKVGRKNLQKPFILLLREDQYHFRQVFFNHGRLRISRQIDLDDELEHDLALNLAMIQETQVAVKYVYNQKLIPFNSEVSFVYLSLNQDDEQEVVALYQDDVALPNWKSEDLFIKSVNLEDMVPGQQHDEDLTAMSVLVPFVKKQNLRTFFRNPYVDKIRQLTQMRLGLLSVAFVVGLFAIHSMITKGVDILVLWDKIEEVDLRITQYEREKQRLQNSAELIYDAEDIKATVTFSEDLLKVKVGGVIGFNLETLGDVLSRHPHILMDDLNWASANNQLDAADVDVTIKGWVFPFETSYENPVKWVDALLKDLAGTDYVVSSELVKEPLNRSLQKPLSIEGSELKVVNALPFSLRFTVRSASEQKIEAKVDAQPPLRNAP